MENVRRIILVLSAMIAVWVFASFGGVMFNTANAAFWTSSLMWAILSFLIVMPALVMINDASKQSRKNAAGQNGPQTRPPEPEEKPFVESEQNGARTLWPEPDDETEWPPEEASKEKSRARA